MHDLLSGIASGEPDCTCDPNFEDDRLIVTADDCPGRGDLAASRACRAAVVSALRERDADVVVTRATGTERRYEDRSAALLVAAGRFAERIAGRDERLADRATADPLGAAREVAGRADPVADVGAETGLLAVAEAAEDYADALRAFVGPTIARACVDPSPPAGGELVESRSLSTGGDARLYEVPGAELGTYHLEPVEATLSADERAALARARDCLVSGYAGTGERAPVRAVRRATDGERTGTLAAVLEKHTRGYGVLEDLFADAGVSDAFATAPAAENALRVRVDGEEYRTNVRLTPAGAAALASQLRRSSGRAFSRANPTIDAAADDVGVADRVRAAGVTEPVADGLGFAFRAHGASDWTVPALVENGTLTSESAALLSLAVERGRAVLVAGARGAGKTTLLSALLWELPAATRTVVMEDTPELPVESLQRRGRDVQALRTEIDADHGVSPAAALRTALRLGEGALVVGEIRGEEAAVLYEAMRVGANASAVLGTVHGDGADDVRERVVSDLGVPASSFSTTDLVVTVENDRSGTEARRLGAVEEVLGDGEFAPLYERAGTDVDATGRAERGNSQLVTSLARGEETYSDVLDVLSARAAFLRDLAETDRVSPDAVVEGHAERRSA